MQESEALGTRRHPRKLYPTLQGCSIAANAADFESAQCGSIPYTLICFMSKGGDLLDVNAITTIIGTLGFPIVACIALFWKLEKEQELHREEVDKLSTVINELKVALTELTTYMKTGA